MSLSTKNKFKINHQCAIQLTDISMQFSSVLACNKINLYIKKGSIHVIAGENGAGKSTLMSILFGMYEPTNGHIIINGQMVKIKNPMHANNLGIGMVHQHFKLVNIFTALENIILGQEPTKGIVIDKKIAEIRLLKIMKLYNLKVDLHTPIYDLTVGQQQRVEILKLLFKNLDILILDEPTSVLTLAEISSLLKTLKVFKAEGKTIVLITHKLSEIKEVADDITVIRHGEVIAHFNNKDLTEAKLSQAIVGKKVHKVYSEIATPGKNILQINNLTVEKIGFSGIVGLKNFSLNIKAGEIVAVAGVGGNGQSELIYSLAGMIPHESGEIIFENVDISQTSTLERLRLGFSHIPEDRQKYGLILNWNLDFNSVLQDHDIAPFAQKYFIINKKINDYAKNIIQKFDVRGAKNHTTKARVLSGGNQQKFIVGRELIRPKTKLLLAVQPTRGLDIGAIEYIHSQLIKTRNAGKAILLVSYELTEVVALADRVVVLNNRQITGHLMKKEIKFEKLGQLMITKAKGSAQ